MTFDVAIIGGGFAGLTAANHAALGGLRPLVFEAGDDDLYMCNSRVATGALHVAFHGPEESAEDLYTAILDVTDGTAREDLARRLPIMHKRQSTGCVKKGANFFSTRAGPGGCR